MIVELGWCYPWWILLDEWGGSTVSSAAFAK